jgi:hypothetical protein
MPVEDKLVALEYNKAVSELRLLESELEYCLAVVDSERETFNNSYRIELTGRNIVFSEQDDEPEKKLNREQRRKRKKVSEQIKKLYKKIATETHPDKLAALSPDERQRKERLFREAACAFDEGRTSLLRALALELEIDLPLITQEDIDSVFEDIKEKKDEVNAVKGTVAYAWTMASDPDIRDKIMTSYVDFIVEAHLCES